jgi:hypothetical protein
MTKRALLALVGLALLLGLGAAARAGGPTPDFQLSAGSPTASVVRGESVQLSVVIAPGPDFSAPVTVGVSGLGSGLSVALVPPGSTPALLRMMTVTASPTATLGTTSLAITATSGKLKHTVTIALSVVAVPAPSFKVSVAPANLNVKAGDSGAYTVSIARTNMTGAVTFSVTGLPASTTATFVPLSTVGNTSTLTVNPAVDAPLGSYEVTVKGTSGSLNATDTTHLTVSAANSKQFAIDGVVDRALAPGVTGYLNLALTNSNNQPLNVTNLTVSLTGTNRPGCATSNFSVTQYSGAYPLTVPANSTKTLAQLGVAQPSQPRVTMINLPVNQDSCKSTGLTLSYAGAGQGN